MSTTTELVAVPMELLTTQEKLALVWAFAMVKFELVTLGMSVVFEYQ